jgi:restriction system protein
MKKNTIKDAVIQVLKEAGKPLTAKAIYNKIIEKDYYRFRAENPPNIVLTLIRRHCEGLDFPSASQKKYFQILNDGTYSIIDENKIPSFTITKKLELIVKSDKQQELKELHSKYTQEFKESILSHLKSIDPENFEFFCKKLLEVYGFKDLKVTQVKKDGGLDGFGKLKVGISYLNVAFQSKRWRTTSVGRTEIDKFRGAIQGDFEQGIFITTSKFSKDALNATTKKGAVPIILIDGSMIVDIMIEKKFGIGIENMPIFINALDEVLSEE